MQDTSFSDIHNHVVDVLTDGDDMDFLNNYEQQEDISCTTDSRILKWIFSFFKAINMELDGDLKEELRTMFVSETKQTLTCPPRKKKLFRKKKDDCKPVFCPIAKSYWMEVDIRNQEHEPLQTIVDVVNNYLSAWEKGAKCKECHSEEKLKQITITTLPDVLLIKYNRYNQLTRDSHDVDCGNSISIFNVHYDLKGVIVHTGDSKNEGHYISLTWNSLSGSWNVIPQPRNITISKLIKQAFVLLFERKQEQEEQQEHQEQEQDQQEQEQEQDHQEQEQEQQEHQEQQER